MTKSKKLIFWVFFNLISLPVFASTLALPDNLIAYNSPAGKQLLVRSANNEFLQLSMQFLTQKNQAYCGVASISMALNALEIKGPDDPVYAPFYPITQDNFFTSQVEQVLDPNQVAHQGMTLDQAAAAAAQFQVNSRAVHSDTLTLGTMRKLLKSTLENEHEYAIINFFRPGLQEQGAGHFSPIAAYDAASDRFLILDVARYKYPPVWVKAEDVWKAIDTTDLSSQKKRGVLILKKPEPKS